MGTPPGERECLPPMAGIQPGSSSRWNTGSIDPLGQGNSQMKPSLGMSLNTTELSCIFIVGFHCAGWLAHGASYHTKRCSDQLDAGKAGAGRQGHLRNLAAAALSGSGYLVDFWCEGIYTFVIGNWFFDKIRQANGQMSYNPKRPGQPSQSENAAKSNVINSTQSQITDKPNS